MEIIYDERYCIIKPLSPKMTEHDADRLMYEIGQSDVPVALDMSFVTDCTPYFLRKLNNIKNLSLYNIQSDIFVLLLNMNLDKILKLFVSEIDFMNNKHQLINRKFSIV